MTIAAEVHLKGTLYYIHRESGELLYSNSGPARYGNQPNLFRRISREQYFHLENARKRQADNLEGVQGCHKGEIIHVFGTGPSLNDFAAKQDWTGKITFGVNAAGRDIKPLTYWSSVDDLYNKSDRALHTWVRQWLIDTQGTVKQFIRAGATVERMLYSVRIGAGKPPLWVPDYCFRYDPHGPHDHITKGVYHTLSSTQSALDIVRHMTPKAAVLWGVDYLDRSHVYTGSDDIKNDALDNPGVPWKRWKQIQEGFEKLAEAYERDGIKLLNANPKSRLECIPKVTPQEGWATQ